MTDTDKQLGYIRKTGKLKRHGYEKPSRKDGVDSW